MKKGAKKVPWTMREMRFISQHWKEVNDAELTKMLNKAFGTKRSVKSVSVYRTERLGFCRGLSVPEKNRQRKVSNGGR